MSEKRPSPPPEDVIREALRSPDNASLGGRQMAQSILAALTEAKYVVVPLDPERGSEALMDALDAEVDRTPLACGRCGAPVPSKHAHKFGLNGYSCQPPTARAGEGQR